MDEQTEQNKKKNDNRQMTGTVGGWEHGEVKETIVTVAIKRQSHGQHHWGLPGNLIHIKPGINRGQEGPVAPKATLNNNNSVATTTTAERTGNMSTAGSLQWVTTVLSFTAVAVD